MRPLISICVASYNQAKFAPLTLESLVAQNYEPFEIIIIDDCSKDDSANVIRNWIDKYYARDIKYKCNIYFEVNEVNSGVCVTFNKALRKARGNYINIIALDDILMPNKFVKQIDLFENSAVDVGVIYSDAYIIDESGKRYFSKFIQWHSQFQNIPENFIFDTLVRANFIPVMTALFKKECFDFCGLFDESLLYEDYDFLLRVSKEYKFKYIDYVCAEYRMHSNNFHKKILNLKALETNFNIFYKYKNESGDNRNIVSQNLINCINGMALAKSKNIRYYLNLYNNSFSNSSIISFSVKYRMPYNFIIVISRIIDLVKSYL